MIDIHTHAWGAASPEHLWINGPILDFVDSSGVHIVYTAERLFVDIDRSGVDEAAIVGYPICDWTDNWYTRRVAAGYDRLYGTMVFDPPVDDVVERLDRCMETDGVLGFRLGAVYPYDRMWEMFNPSMTWLRGSVEEVAFRGAAVGHDVTVQIPCGRGQFDQTLELVGAYPELTYLLDHFAHTGPEAPTDEEMFGQFADLAGHDSVAVEASEIVHMSGSVSPYVGMHDHVRWLLDTFGRERVVWGSDYPNANDVVSHAEVCSWLRQADSSSEADRSWPTEKPFRRHVDLG